MEQQLPRYQTLILRFWIEKDPLTKEVTYRFSLENPASGQRFGFRQLGDLCDFLKAEINKLDVP